MSEQAYRVSDTHDVAGRRVLEHVTIDDKDTTPTEARHEFLLCRQGSGARGDRVEVRALDASSAVDCRHETILGRVTGHSVFTVD